MGNARTAAWLRLALTPGLGPARSLKLIQKFNSIERAIAAPSASLAPLIGCKVANALKAQPTIDSINVSLRWAEQPNCHLITLDDDDYPLQLASIPSPPLVLFAHGKRELLSSAMLAMVGSRHASAQGKRNTEVFSQGLAKHGYTIVSGLAEGIDTACHVGALEYPASTIAIIGNGIDRLYPSCNRRLSERIGKNGLIISEFPLGTPPQPKHFPRRNRIIAGLALGCLVVEASVRSGSLITARYAADTGREVMAIPGSIHNRESRGCHFLIKQGASLVETIEDVLKVLGYPISPKPNTSVCSEQFNSHKAPKDLRVKLLDFMHTEPVTLDELSTQMNIAPGELSAMLLEFELEGHIASLAGGRYQRLF